MKDTMFLHRNSQIAVAAVVAAVTFSDTAFVTTATPLGEDAIDVVTSPSTLSPLDCDAYASPKVEEGRVVHSFYDDMDGNDKNGEGSELAPSMTTVSTQPPSVAPSMAPPCSDPLSNARGQYTTTMAPCIIKFHNVFNHQREGQEEEDYLIDYHTSHLCHDSNIIVEIKEYLTAWPDECVGDFARCYSLEHHFDLLCDFLCERQFPVLSGAISQTYKPRWELPPGTTHISVECTIDKDLVHEQGEKESRTRHKEVQDVLRQDMETKLLNWIMVVLASCAIIIALSRLVVMPLVSVEIARRNNNERRRRQRRRSRSSSYRHHHHSGSAVTATSRSNSRGSSSDSLPMHHPPQEHLTLIAQAESEEEVAPMDGYHRRRHGPNDDVDDDDDYLSSDSSSGSGDLSRSTSVSEDFDAQIPADFDAVPIVAATILPTMTLRATVIQDGITYT